MELKVLKKEIEELRTITSDLLRFKHSWIKQVKPGTNQQYFFLHQLKITSKKKLNSLLKEYQLILKQLNYVSFTQEKMVTLSGYLIELKLAQFNKDPFKPAIIYKKFTQDDFLNLNQMKDEINQLDFDLSLLKRNYQQVNRFLKAELSARNYTKLSSGKHRYYLNKIILTAKKQQKWLNQITEEFKALTKNQQLLK